MIEEDPIKIWQHFHGATVHFALSLALVSIAFDLGSVIFGKREWRTVGFWCLLVAALLSVPAILSGLWGQLGWFKATPWDAEQLLKHRNFALGGGISQIVLFVWRSVTHDFGANSRDRKGPGYTIYLVLAVLAAAAMGYTGYLGGYVARGY